jgi:hypothetical protein
MSKAISKEDMALLKEASEMFNETLAQAISTVLPSRPKK